MNPLSEAARETARRTADAATETAKRATSTAKDVTGALGDVAGDVSEATRHAARCASDTAKDMYESAKLRAGDTLVTSKEYVRRNPVPVVLGAFALGAAIGYMLMMSRRRPTFSENYVDEPLVAVRKALRSAFAPAAKCLHSGYDTARDGAGKAMDRVHGFGTGRRNGSLAHQIGRFGNNLKFW